MLYILHLVHLFHYAHANKKHTDSIKLFKGLFWPRAFHHLLRPLADPVSNVVRADDFIQLFILTKVSLVQPHHGAIQTGAVLWLTLDQPLIE